MMSITEKMRAQRLRYAILREIDRQTVVMEDEAIASLVATAMRNIDGAYSDEDARGEQAEAAEKCLMPIISSLAISSDGDITDTVCTNFLQNPTPRLFPWSDPDPAKREK